MKLFETVMKGILSTDTLVSELNAVQKEYSEITAPMIDNTKVTLGSAKYTGQAGRLFSNTMGQLNRSLPASNTLALHFENFELAINTLRGMINEELGTRTSEVAVTFRKANLIQFVHQLGFASRYTRMLLTSTLVELTESDYAKSKYNKHILDYLEANALSYKNTLRALGKDPKDIMAALKKVPEIDLQDTDVLTASGVASQSELDPFGMGLVSADRNPFFLLGRKFVEFQHRRYEAAKVEMALYEQQLEQLRLKNQGKNDASLEKAIEVFENEVETARAKVERHEERYGI